VTYDSEPREIPLFYRRQESSEDHRVPTLNNLQRVSSFEDLSDDSSGTCIFCNSRNTTEKWT